MRVRKVTINPDGSLTVDSGDKVEQRVDDDKEVVLLIDGMPRPRPPTLHRETNRHGKVVWYVRNGHGPRIRIKGVLRLAGIRESLSGPPLTGTRHSPPARPAKAPLAGCGCSTGKPRPGPACPSPPESSASASCARCWRLAATSHCHRSPRGQSSKALSAARRSRPGALRGHHARHVQMGA